MKVSGVAKFLLGITLGITLALLVAFNTLLIWVATGPRSLDNFTPYIERSLSGESNVQVDIGHTWILWDGWKHPIDIRLKGVSLLTREGVVFSTFPEISLGLDVLALPFGQVLPTSISVSKPIVSIRQRADKSLDFGAAQSASPTEQNVDNNSETIALLIDSLINPHSKSSLRKLDTIELLNANISIGNDADGVIVSAPDSTFVVRKESRSEINMVLRGTVQYSSYESPVAVQVAYNKEKKRFEGALETTRLNIAALSGLLADDPVLNALQLPVSGRIGFAVNDAGKLDALRFAIEGGRGKIIHEKLDGALPVTSMKINGHLTDGLTRGAIEKLEADLDGSRLQASGEVIQSEQGTGISAQASITNVPTGEARIYWPLGLAPLSRDWVTGNIKDGKITSASVVLNIKPGELALPALPKEAVDAKVELRDARIKYLEGHPEVRGVDATIKVDGLALDAAISTASAFADTKLTNGRVYIADLNPDNPLIEVSMHADALASDIVTLLGLPMLEHAKHLNLDAKKVSGRAVGDAKLGFYFFAKDENGKDLPMYYHVKAQVADVTTPAFLRRFDIANATGELAVDEKAIDFAGSATVNGTRLNSGKVRYSFEPENGIDTTIQASGTVDDGSFKRFGVELPIALREPVAVTMDATLATYKDATTIPSFSVKGEGVNVVGKATLTQDGADLDTMSLEKIRYGKTNLDALEYTSIPGGYVLSIRGQSFDLNDFFAKEGEGFSFEKFPAIDLSVDIGTLYGAENETIENTKGTLVCSISRCGKANISGAVGGKPFYFRIVTENKIRKVAVASDNAGGLLRALDILPTMQGGTLTLGGQYADNADGALAGNLRIDDYTLVNAPVLARMLSLASLTGFFDALSGKGIGFKKLDAPFTLQNDVVTLKDARAYGPAIGLTADGTITFPKTTLDLNGTIVPSYTLNNVVGKVPLLGDILTGGEGQGVFAARYTMKGDSDNPDVMVNPLSILTPGFLRNLFDVF